MNFPAFQVGQRGTICLIPLEWAQLPSVPINPTGWSAHSMQDRWTNLATNLLNQGYDIAGAAGPAILRNDAQQGDIRLMATTLIARSLSHMRGVLILLREKRLVEARTLARSILENQFWLAGFSEEPERFRKLMIDGDKNRRGASGQALFETGELSDEVGEQVRNWMRENKDWNKLKSVAPKEVAKNARQSDAYVFYSYLSSDSHPTVAALDRYVTSVNGVVTGLDLDPKPTDEEIVDTLGLACYGLVIVLVAGCKILRSPGATSVDELAQEYLGLMKEQGDLNNGEAGSAP